MSNLFVLLRAIADPELKGVPVEVLVKLIPEHARKQCPFLGLWVVEEYEKHACVP